MSEIGGRERANETRVAIYSCMILLPPAGFYFLTPYTLSWESASHRQSFEFHDSRNEKWPANEILGQLNRSNTYTYPYWYKVWAAWRLYPAHAARSSYCWFTNGGGGGRCSYKQQHAAASMKKAINYLTRLQPDTWTCRLAGWERKTDLLVDM